MDNNLKPIKRSKLRLALGKRYYTVKRYLGWTFSKENYVGSLLDDSLEHLVFTHQTPLRRHLKDVDRYIDDNKIKNLKIAIKSMDGLIIKPNQTFSYWQLIGRPTYRKGYVDGMVLDHGKYKLGVGGGLCQLSNMLFWMVLHTPLQVTERHRHSYDVFPDSKRTQPFGSGATCVYNYRDFQFKNTSNETYQIKLKVDEQHLIGEIRSTHPRYLSYEIYESSHEITQGYWGTYIRHNTIDRKVFDLNMNLLDDHRVCENKALMMYSPLLNPPKTFEREDL
ncbi:vancomycin resistance protein [Acidaminobacter sp. JC074]|uniref:VanW family protein n=1 Tax=Acidaminobacter sp. JC074 TaxID=2530199 RepID=UPI001F0D0001|nr:VanW family protein [Acidaminobacter sp. JC074]MCH4886216.1 vancomycin resistance protein [Acidaminobacter sp. JC074]